MARAIGIDLGTSNSAAAVVEGLLAAGLSPAQIVIWDQKFVDLRLAGYVALGARYGVRVASSADAGYDTNSFYETALLGKLLLILPVAAFYLTPQEQLKFVFRANRPGWVDLVRPGDIAFDEEPWKVEQKTPRFRQMQARAGDHAIFFRKAAAEISFEDQRYLVVPQAAILVLVRDDV